MSKGSSPDSREVDNIECRSSGHIWWLSCDGTYDGIHGVQQSSLCIVCIYAFRLHRCSVVVAVVALSI
jgi:hypothetical protein